MRPLLVPLALAGALLALSRWPSVAASAGLAGSFLAVGTLLAAASLLVGAHASRTGRQLRIRFVPVTAHWVQIGIHLALFTVWARSWEGVAAHAPHILGQILFYYAFDLILSWLSRDEARTGFGPIPIVGSVNLFLWFQDDLFLLQFGLLALGALGKELIQWERDGRRTHVFNPSSFPLFLVCAVLWAIDGDANTWAGNIAVTQGLIPNAWLIIFALGLVVQSLFATTLVSLAALGTLFVLNLLYTQVTGVYCWVDVGIPASIFLGCTFLVTDPATSPRTARGRAVFGALYGLAVFGLYLWLREVGGPAYYDKLLCVPFLNLMVRRLDRLGGRRAAGSFNLLWVGVGSGVFAALYLGNFLGPDHPGKSTDFWQAACEDRRWHACNSYGDVLFANCHDDDWEACDRYASLRSDGVHLPVDGADAGYHLALACQGGVAAACKRIPDFLGEGGEEALLESCSEAEGLACLVLGTLQLSAAPPPSQAGIDGAHEHVRRACDLGIPEACAFVEEELPAR